jgi:small-conductance mechanosensitive channel
MNGLREWMPIVRIGLLVFAGVALDMTARVVSSRIVRRMGDKRAAAGDIERRQRGATLVSFATSVARVIVWVSVVLSLLSEVNINVGPIVAGAGVIGAALAFGAQNIVKDYLAGFFILFENQYTLGDVVKIGAVSGTVEDITMRITVLRGLDGAMHVIPNGTIQLVSNMTSVWARAVVDVGIAYGGRVDEALAALRRVGKGLHEDADGQWRLLEPPEVPGVVALGDASVTLRLQAKVVAEEQWNVKNELLRRIKNELDAVGIPFPALPAGAAPGPARAVG